MTIVVDASVVVAALTATDDVGAWAEALLVRDSLCAPTHLPVEVANVLRRLEHARKLSQAAAAAAHRALQDLDLILFGYEALGDRVWQLRANTTAYDAAYVALAERLAAPLATLDVRLSAAKGARCRWLLPPG